MRALLLLLALGAISSDASAQHDHQHPAGMGTRSPLEISVHAIAVGTSTNISPNGRRLAEGYFTQPWVMAMYRFPRNVFTLEGMLNLEGLTIKRGELSPGIWGEGYIDRRHPHTYVHEVVLAAEIPRRFLGTTASLTFGKGFVSFGTDDPMVRPFVKYPANHHLAQVLERVVLVGALRRGPVTAEYTLFNGDEPQSPGDFPTVERFGDSWAARATLHLNNAGEVQSSFARVVSPENAGGGGQDQRKVSVSARYELRNKYALAEFAQTREEANGKSSFQFRTFLTEGSVSKNGYTFAARVEVTERPEEERLTNAFRTPQPPSDFHLNGITRWGIATVAVGGQERNVAWAMVAPFVELSAVRTRAIIANSVFNPEQYYRGGSLWSFSAGVRFSGGQAHSRMGRYGVLRAH